jgi:DNA-binding LytR/AlgR family response regulator
VHCYDYILKPYDMADVVNMTKRFILHNDTINDTPKENHYIVFEIIKGISVKVYVEDILFIEVNLQIRIIHTVNGVYNVNKLSLNKIIKRINCDNIIQCHKSFAVNIKQISKIENVDSKLSKIYFENYDKNALLGYKFKNIVKEQFQ